MPRRRQDLLRLLAQTSTQQIPVLDLSNCNLSELIDEVCAMDWLVELNLSHCHLHLLPSTMGNCTRLQRLILSENQLTALPDSVTRLTELQYIDLKSCGLECHVSEEVMAWLKTVPEVIWKDGNPLGYEPPRPYFLPLGHPNQLLEQLKRALKLYGDALSMEDHNIDGDGARQQANAMIAETFAQAPSLQEVLPDFYQDFQAQRFYSTTCASEEKLNENPLRLPTRADEEWSGLTGEPLRLGAEVIAGRGRVLTVTQPESKKIEIAAYPYGEMTLSNMPYAADEQYRADCAAWLYQAGSERFYLRVEVYGYSSSRAVEWLGSSDNGRFWIKQPVLTYEWLEKMRGTWRMVDHLPPSQSRS